MRTLTLVQLILWTDAVLSFTSFSLQTSFIVERSRSLLHGSGLPIMVPAEEQDEEQSIFSRSSIKRHIQEKAKLIQSLTRRSDSAVVTIDTIQEYKKVVVEESTRIVVVRFHATWCKSCKAAEPHFMKLVSKYSTQAVKFVQVPLTQETGNLQNALGVPSVPYAHIYYPGAGLVEELKLSKPHIQDFDNILTSYVEGYCTLPSSESDFGHLPIIGAFE